jgi:hypothetical protein
MKPVKYLAATALIGDGAMAIVQPSFYARVWKKGPKAWRVSMEWLAERPAVTRAIGAAEIVGGVLWMLHECNESTSRERPYSALQSNAL